MKRIAFIILVMTVTLSLCSCSLITSKISDAIGDKINEVAGEALLENILGGDVQIGDDGSFSYSGENGDVSYMSSWPTTELAQKVPAMDTGDSEIYAYETDGSLYITLSNVTRAQFDSYAEKVRSGGFTLEENTESEYYVLSGDSSDGAHTVMLSHITGEGEGAVSSMIIFIAPKTETEG